MLIILTLFCGLFLAYANGANDNFKGVATLLGSGTTNYKTALIWATITTFLGSIVALVISKGMIATFTGIGLVDEAVVGLPHFPMAVAAGAAATVLLASVMGLPISTTHAITGALIGPGLLVSSNSVNFSLLGSKFFLPLLLSPFLAGGFAFVAHFLVCQIQKARSSRLANDCICIGEMSGAAGFVGSRVATLTPTMAARMNADITRDFNWPTVTIGTTESCEREVMPGSLQFKTKNALNLGHFASSGIVSFARGLNDTPKIAALLLAASFVQSEVALILVGVVIAIGGWLGARKVAQTMAHEVTSMNSRQGLMANLVTGAVVVGASKFGLPVSTTHVSCGSLFGLGAATKEAKAKAITKIIGSWVLTLPLAAGLAAVGFKLFELIL